MGCWGRQAASASKLPLFRLFRLPTCMGTIVAYTLVPPGFAVAYTMMRLLLFNVMNKTYMQQPPGFAVAYAMMRPPGLCGAAPADMQQRCPCTRTNETIEVCRRSKSGTQQGSARQERACARTRAERRAYNNLSVLPGRCRGDAGSQRSGINRSRTHR